MKIVASHTPARCSKSENPEDARVTAHEDTVVQRRRLYM